MYASQFQNVATAACARPIRSSNRLNFRVCAHDQQSPKSSGSDRPTSRRDLLKGGATVGLGGIAARTLRLLGVGELSQVPRGLTPLMAEVSKGAQLLQRVVPNMRPTVEHLLKIGMKPTDVLRMLENPALRPRNAVELQRWIR